jgi:WD40 repeat protein
MREPCFHLVVVSLVTLVAAAPGREAPLVPPERVESRDLAGHAGDLGCAAFSADGSLVATGCYDKTVRVFDAVTGILRASFPFGDEVDNSPDKYGMRSRGLQRALAFSPDGTRLAAGGGDWIPAATLTAVFDLAAKKRLYELRRHRQFVQGVAFSLDGSLLATASHDATVRPTDAATGQDRGTLTGHDWSVTAVAFAADGKSIASASCNSRDKAIKFWDPATLREVRSVKLPEDVHALAFSRDGKLLAGVSNWRLTVWDTATLTQRDATVLDRGLFNCLAVSPDGKRIAAGGEQGPDGVGILRLYDWPAKTCHVVFELLVEKVFAVTWAGNDRLLAVGGRGSAVRLVSVPLREK